MLNCTVQLYKSCMMISHEKRTNFSSSVFRETCNEWYLNRNLLNKYISPVIEGDKTYYAVGTAWPKAQNRGNA